MTSGQLPSKQRISAMFLFVLLGGMLLLTPSTGVTQEPEQEFGDPPTLTEIIRNVRKKTRPLDRALVKVNTKQGAEDGGGRLYWKRGEFVRSRNYRIGSRTTVDVYDVVSNQSARTFLFHTNQSEGQSFTFSLRMPYEKASTIGYGLSDHYFLEYVANRRFDVKYAGKLMSLQLFPEQLKTFGKRYDISYVTRDGAKHLRLRRHKTMFRSFYFTEEILIDPSTWRFEQIKLEDQRRIHRLQVVERQNIHGVALPETIRIDSPQFKQSLPYHISYHVQTGQQLDRKIHRPHWLDDLAIPEVSQLSTRKIHQKLEKDVTGTLYRDLLQAGLRYRYMQGPTHFHTEAFHTSVDIARRRLPESRLLKAYKDGIASQTRITEKEMYVTTFPSISSQVILPYMNYAAAYRSLLAGHPDRVQRYLKPIRDRYPYNHIADRLDDRSSLQQATTAVEFLEVMKDIADAHVRAYSSIVPMAVRKLRNNQKWVADVKGLAERRTSVMLNLILARYARSNDRFSDANRYYQAVADEPFLRAELRSYLRQAGFRARWLVNRFGDRTTSPGILIRLALKQYQEGKPERAIATVERTIDLLKRPKETNPGKLNAGDQSVGDTLSDLIALVRRLQEGKKGSLIDDLLQGVVQLYGINWDKRADVLETFSDLYRNTRMDRRYRLVRNFVKRGRTEAISRFLDPGSFQSYLLDTVRKNNAREEDLHTLSRAISLELITDEEALERSIPVLERARQRFDTTDYERPDILYGLADAHYQLKQYDRASPVYRDFLSLIRKRRHPKFYADVFQSVSPDRVVSAYSKTDPKVRFDDPVLLKYTHALIASGTEFNKIEQKITPFIRLYRVGLTPALSLILIDRKKQARKQMLLRFHQEQRKGIGRPLMMALGGIFTANERYGAAALIYNMGLRRLKIQDETVKELYRAARQNMDQSRMIDELKQQDFGTPSRKTRQFVNRKLRQLTEQTDQKQTMKLVSRIMNSGQNVVPVLLEKTDASSAKVRKLVRKMLETIRMRQIYRKLFAFPSLRSKF